VQVAQRATLARVGTAAGVGLEQPEAEAGKEPLDDTQSGADPYPVD